ncbi:MarR family winged helix-turn-helix transcriptional regulator [Sphingomonas sp. 3-13AW]|uniref:MarR family winged helix-turn-helix transcriptional regulator n=1 Tax=Sphingomonas sp. 3-13AW TaxID=3050450 RepID=UPI003BB4C414
MIEEEQEDRVSLGVLDTLVGYHMRRLSTLFATDFANAVGDLGLRQVLFGILSIVGGNPGINQGEVGKALGIQRANMVSLVNELVDRELIDRRVAAEDRRAFELRLTPAGERCVEEAIGRIREHEDMLLSDLSAQERASLIQLLSRIGAGGG